MPDSPARAVARRDAARRIRNMFSDRCAQLGVRRGVPMMMSRWIVDQDHGGVDPIFVEWPEFEQLRVELTKERVRVRDLDQLQYDMTCASREAIAQVTSIPTESGAVQLTPPDARNNHWTVSFDGVRYSIRDSHYSKLRRIFASASGDDDSLFPSSLFCLLSRYTLLDDVGYQAALPSNVFDTLTTEFGITCECFASPLNCHYGRFFSAFPDTDTAFGSRGSFFDFAPPSEDTSLEANPPFTVPLMKRMALHIEYLLTNATAALSIAVFIPCWVDSEAWEIMRNSRFLRRLAVISKMEHGYLVGDQHVAAVQRLPATFDTGVFFLQNDAALQRWAPTDARMDALRKAFVESRPAMTAEEQRKRDAQMAWKHARDVKDGRPQAIAPALSLAEYVAPSVRELEAAKTE